MKDQTSPGRLSGVILTIFETDVPIQRLATRSGADLLGSWIRKGSCIRSHAARAGRDRFFY